MGSSSSMRSSMASMAESASSGKCRKKRVMKPAASFFSPEEPLAALTMPSNASGCCRVGRRGVGWQSRSGHTLSANHIVQTPHSLIITNGIICLEAAFKFMKTQKHLRNVSEFRRDISKIFSRDISNGIICVCMLLASPSQCHI